MNATENCLACFCYVMCVSFVINLSIHHFIHFHFSLAISIENIWLSNNLIISTGPHAVQHGLGHLLEPLLCPCQDHVYPVLVPGCGCGGPAERHVSAVICSRVEGGVGCSSTVLMMLAVLLSAKGPPLDFMLPSLLDAELP